MKTAIYCRISTDEQDLKQQINSCIKYCELKGWEYEIYQETGSSAKERPIWNTLLLKARQGNYKNIVVFRLDRAWRNSRQFIMDYDNLQNNGIYVISITEGLDPSTPMGKAMMTILVALAELERVNISVATKHRLQALKNMGKHLGRPFGSKDTKKRENLGYLLREANKRSNKNLANKYTDKNFDK